MWRPDLLSFLLGIGLGLLSGAVFFFWLWPRLEQEGALLWARWRRTYEWVQSNAEGRYRTELAQRLAQHHELAQVGDLAQLFTPPRLSVPALEVEPEAAATAAWGPRQLYWLWPELAERSAAPFPAVLSLSQLWRDGRRVLLSGTAGAGKSTLLAYTGYVCARGDAAELTSYFPVWLHTADLAHLGWPEGAAGLLAALPWSSGRGGDALADVLAQKLAAGQALLLLDGADEMPASTYPQLANWLQALLRQFPDTRVIAAAPTQGYAPLLLPGFVLSRLMPWRSGQAQRLAQQWATASGQPEPALAHFWAPGQLAWQTVLRLSQVGENPEETSRRWIDRLEAALSRRLPTDARELAWLAPAARELWQEVAWRCLSQPQGALPLDDVLALIETVCARYQVGERNAARRLLELSQKSGLFAGSEGKLWRILSPIWRDFLAAAHLAQTQPPSRIQPLLSERHWAGVIRFYVTRVGVGGLIEQLLRDNETDPLQDGLFQAAAWLPEVVEPGEWRRQILLRLGRLIVQPKVPAALRQRAVLALAQTEETGVVTLLRQLLQRPDPLVRQAAVAALPILGAAAALDLLSQALADEDVDVRQGVVAALGWLHHPAADKLVLRVLSGEDEQLFTAAAEAVGLNGGAGADVLKEAAGEDDPHLRRAAVLGLVLVEEPWAYALLQRLQKDDQWLVQSVAGIAVELREGKGMAAHWWQPALPGDQAWLIQWAAAQGRGVPGGAAGLAVLLQAMQPSQSLGVRLAAITCAAQMVELDAVPALQAVLEDPLPAVREAAFQALCQLSRAFGRWVGS